jgi:gas vesicle protein
VEIESMAVRMHMLREILYFKGGMRNMSEDHSNITVKSGLPGWLTGVLVLLGALAIAGVGYGWHNSTQLDIARQTTATDVRNIKQTVDVDLAGVKDRLARSENNNEQLQSDLSVVTKRLRITQGQLKTAREEAAQMREEATQKFTALDSSVQGVRGELTTKASTDDLKTTNGQVSEVRTDLTSTKNDLQMARSELGTLIARTHEDVEQLRRLGERDYYEFTVAGKGKSQKVGNVTVELRGVNQKKNQCDIALTAEDKRYEKKNRAANEPIFFYLQGTRVPEEVVINKIGKNEISGYVSVPKANQQKAPATGGTSGQ